MQRLDPQYLGKSSSFSTTLDYVALGVQLLGAKTSFIFSLASNNWSAAAKLCKGISLVEFFHTKISKRFLMKLGHLHILVNFKVLRVSDAVILVKPS